MTKTRVQRRCPLCKQTVWYEPTIDGAVMVEWHHPPSGVPVATIGNKGHCWYSGTVLTKREQDPHAKSM